LRLGRRLSHSQQTCVFLLLAKNAAQW
jgi:hypothetical protein